MLKRHICEWFCHFSRILYSRTFAYAKFRENKILGKISEFTVARILTSSTTTLIVYTMCALGLTQRPRYKVSDYIKTISSHQIVEPYLDILIVFLKWFSEKNLFWKKIFGVWILNLVVTPPTYITYETLCICILIRKNNLPELIYFMF